VLILNLKDTDNMLFNLLIIIQIYLVIQIELIAYEKIELQEFELFEMKIVNETLGGMMMMKTCDFDQ
jgi:hypothetical protein